jgi:hypothetical protein
MKTQGCFLELLPVLFLFNSAALRQGVKSEYRYQPMAAALGGALLLRTPSHLFKMETHVLKSLYIKP